MPEPLRHVPADGPVTEADRVALIEKLLLAGLDHYFEGRYEQAVNVWTRVAFLERGHGRARAYIERARGALAERQRHAEELLHGGMDAYRSGDVSRARDLLTKAVEEGASDTALVFLQRLGRVDALDEAVGGAPAVETPPLDRRAAEVPPPRTRGARVTNWGATVLVSAALAASILLAAQPIASWLGDRPVAAPVIESRPVESLPVLRKAALQLTRARELRAAGRPHAALRVLATVDRADPLRADADRLTADIQRDLLVPVPVSAPPEGSVR